MKKFAVRLLLCFGAILLLLAVLLLSSSIYSKRAVKKYQDQLRAAGEKLNVEELIPPHPDPDKNGASLFNDASHGMTSSAGALVSNSPPAMRMVAPGKAMVTWRQSKIVSPESTGWITNTWNDIEQALQSQSPALTSLRRASERSEIDFNMNYRLGAFLRMPHLIAMKEAALVLSPAAIDALHRGDSAEAVTNIHTLLALVNAWKEPVLISQLVRIAMTQMAVPGQWELLQSSNVTDQQLELLQRDWAALDFGRAMEHALVVERAWSSVTIQQLRTSNSPSSAVASGLYGSGSRRSAGPGSWLGSLGSSAKHKAADTLWRVAWSHSDELQVLKGDGVLLEAMRQAQTNGYFKDALSTRDRKLGALWLHEPGTDWLRNKLDDRFASWDVESVQSVSHSLERVLAVEAARRITVASIALKRYQLRHAKFPPELNALVPEFLPEVPRDPVDGHALRYQLNTDGTFALYSIGTDSVDNGGDPTPDGTPKSLQWQRGRDWVWPQPATAEEIRKFYENQPK